jgi:hypothetical protein
MTRVLKLRLSREIRVDTDRCWRFKAGDLIDKHDEPGGLLDGRTTVHPRQRLEHSVWARARDSWSGVTAIQLPDKV